MTRAEAWFLHASTLLVGATGLVYGWMRYFATSDDPFSLVDHPQQPLLRDLHIVFAPLLVFACGVVWLGHIWVRVRSDFPTRRRTGVLLACLVAPMIASGYLLQVTIDETWKTVWIWLHVASSLGWTAGLVVHLLTRRGTPARADAGV